MKNRIKEVRKAKNITQQKLVKNISITRQYISLIELGNETPSLKVANEIAMSLDTCIYSIFDLDGTGDFKCPCCPCCPCCGCCN